MKKEEFPIYYSNYYKQYYIIVGNSGTNNIRKYIKVFDKPSNIDE